MAINCLYYELSPVPNWIAVNIQALSKIIPSRGSNWFAVKISQNESLLTSSNYRFGGYKLPVSIQIIFA